MAYSKEIYDEALNILGKRRRKAQAEADAHRNELSVKYPKFTFIENELLKTGAQIVSVLSLPEDKAMIKFAEIRKHNKELREERENLLKTLGLPIDYLEPHYVCEKCEDTGFYEERNDEIGVSYGTKLCSCHIDLLKKLAFQRMSRITPLELSSFDDFDLSFYSKSGVDGNSPYNIMKNIYEQCVQYAENFDIDAMNLFFYGRTGLGKTHISLSIANEVIKKGYNVVYGSVINFLNRMEKEKFGRTEDLDTENMLIEADLLILDDLGAEFTTPLTTSMIYNILNSRICRGVPTIISSNLSIKELSDRDPESVASRIIGTFALVPFAGKDVRQIKNM